MKKKLLLKLKEVYRWFLYYPYMILFSAFAPTDIEAIGVVGKDENEEDVMIASMYAQFKLCRHIRIPLYLAACRCNKYVWGVRILSKETFFAYQLGAVEEETITYLVRVRLV